MICITIAQESRHLLLADMLNAASMGADLVEVRLDCLEHAPQFGDMMTAKRMPVLFSCRRVQDGGQWKGSEEERLMLLRQAIMSKADYVEIEYDVAEQVRPFPGCKRVISYTNTSKMPSAIGDIYDDMLALKPDIIKLTVRARTPEEAWPLVQIMARQKVPTVVVGIGRPGVMLAVLGKKIGAPWTSAALERGMETFPGQPTIRDLVDIYQYREIGKATRFVGVAGLGEREFLSAGLLNAAFKELGLPHRVLPLAVGSLKLFRKVIDVVKLQAVSMEAEHYGHVGEAAALDSSARSPVLAGDFLTADPTQGWVASNLLGEWAVEALKDQLRDHDPSKAEPLQGRSVMLAGCGMLARMIAPSLKANGAALIFASKDRALAQSLGQAFGGRQVAWEGIYTTMHDVLVVAGDPATDSGDVTDVPIHPGYLKSSITVIDLTAYPRRSTFAKEAAHRSANIVAPSALLAAQVRAYLKKIAGTTVERTFLNEKLAGWLNDDDDDEQ